MCRYLLFLVLPLLNIYSLRAQSGTADFELITPAGKVPKSLYNIIRVLDCRPDTTNMGMARNTRDRVIPRTPFPLQLQAVVDSLVDSTAGNGELLLQLRQFSFVEEMKSRTQQGYCFLRMILYARGKESGNREAGNNAAGNKEDYYRLDGLDTMMLITSKDFTRTSVKNISQAVTDLVAKNLAIAPGDPVIANRNGYSATPYSHSALTRLDSLEKKDMKLYNTTSYAEGVYISYGAFKNQAPDYQILKISYDTGRISAIRVAGKDGKSEKLKNTEIYAIVNKGIPMVSTEFGYFPVYKTSDDFFFLGRSRQAPSALDRASSQFSLGLVGLLLLQGEPIPYEMRIDHVTGRFIPMRLAK